LHSILISIILGIIEGITEFLPVSSTAHLKIAEHLFLGDAADTRFWDMFTIVIQLGAILALPVYFYPRIKKFIGTFPQGERGDRTIFTHPLSLTFIAFVVTSVPAFLLTKLIKKNLDNMQVIAGALVIGGAIMWAVDALFRTPNTNHMEEMTLPQAVWIGFCQIFSAVFPGTSRSMSTIAGGQIAGMSRSAALEFSFFLSMPTMAAATLWTLYKSIFPKHSDIIGEGITPLHVTPQQWILVMIGTVISFIVALGVVAWFMQWVRRRGFAPFAIYRIVLGLFVLLLLRNH
jgi:undecaprenyl-diphosphatase